MIENKAYLEEFERQVAVEEKVDYARNLRIYEAMYEEAVALGIFPLSDPFDGVEDDIRIAAILNRIPKTQTQILNL